MAGRFSQRSNEVDATRVTEDIVYRGMILVSAGAWILRSPTGAVLAMTDADFRSQFSPVDEAGHLEFQTREEGPSPSPSK